MDDKLLFNVPEACRLLNISRSKLFMEMKQDRLDWVSIGNRRLIHRDELHRYASSLKRAA